MMDRVSNVWAWRTFSSYGGRGERWGQHIKKSKQHTNESHLLFTKGQTKGNKVPGDECLRTDKERGSGDECLRTDKEGRQLLVRTSVALLTKLVSSFQPGYWCLILHTHRERHSGVPVSTKGKLTWPLSRWRQKYPHKVPNATQE